MFIRNHNIVKMDNARRARLDAKAKAAEDTPSEKKSVASAEKYKEEV